MSLLETIARLNFSAAWDFDPIPQRRFFAMLSLHFHYPNSSKIVDLTGKFLENSGKFENSDVKSITANSMIAMLVSEIAWDRKIQIIRFLMRWLSVQKISEEITACLIQCITSIDIGFNEIYVIRNSVWNYMTKASLQKTTIFTILESGRVQLEPRYPEEFQENSWKKKDFIFTKQSVLVNPEHSLPMFSHLAKYDQRFVYNRMLIELEARIPNEPLEEPMSNYKASGFSKSAVATSFGMVRKDNNNNNNDFLFARQKKEHKNF